MPIQLEYRPDSVAVIVAGHIVEGFSDGTFVSVSRNENAFTLKVGNDGQPTRSKSPNKSGQIKITLQASSPSNDYLSALAIADEQTSAGAVPVLVRDGSGRTVVAALQAWVQKMPTVEFGKEVSEREWIFESGAVTLNVGGSLEIPAAAS